MILLEIIQKINVGGFLSVAVILLSLIEIVPIKICPLSPLRWIGKRINSEAISRIDNVEKKIDAVEKKIDEHVAQSYRNKILLAQNQLLMGQAFTLEEFDEIIEACENYELYCKVNNIPNEKCKLAIKYLYDVYQNCKANRSFANLPDLGGGAH